MSDLKLVRMDRRRISEIVAVLMAVAEKAEAGDITGIALCYQESSGRESSVIAGSYARSRDNAAAAALRMSMKLAEATGEYKRSR